LSGGNRQRVNVALGLIADPPVLALDEPSASLDPGQRERLWEFIGRLAAGGTTVLFSTHNIGEVQRHAGRMLLLGDGRLLFDGIPASLPGPSPAETSSRRWSRSCASTRPRARDEIAAPKGLLILGRSRLLLALLVIYPIAIALLIGFAISRSPSKPRVAIVDETPPGQTVRVGSQRVSVSQYAQEIFKQVDAVPVGSREEAIEQIKSGQVLAAVVIPANIAARISSDVSQGNLEVLYNGDALEQSLVQSSLESALAQANLGFSEQIQQAAAKAIQSLLTGGTSAAWGRRPT